MKMDGEAAFAAALRNPARNYPGRTDGRFLPEELLFPAISPGFRIGTGDTVFTIGSCFARNVERALLAEGVTVPTAAFAAPEDETPGQPNRILNQYNPATMLQCLEAADLRPDTRGLYPAGEGQVVDALLATRGRPVTEERALERRAEISALYRDGLAAADAVIVTLGLIECWYDTETRLYLNEAPPRRTLRAAPGRFEFRRLGVGESRDLVFAMLDRLVGDAGRPVILTVSPVPLQVTFAGGDALVANGYSKALLRVVAQEAAERFDSVDYFPSYEVVTTAGLRAYGEDNVHVRKFVVEAIISRMLIAYGHKSPGKTISGG